MRAGLVQWDPPILSTVRLYFETDLTWAEARQELHQASRKTAVVRPSEGRKCYASSAFYTCPRRP